MTSSSLVVCEKCGEPVKTLVLYDNQSVCNKCAWNLINKDYGTRPQDGGAVTTSPQKTSTVICPHCGEQFFKETL